MATPEYYQAHRAEILARAKVRYRRDPSVRRRLVAATRRYRRAQPKLGRIARLADRMLQWWRERRAAA